MSDNELAELLARIQAMDPRIGGLDRVALESWRDLVGDLHYGVALDAVREHYRTSNERIMASDIRRGHHEIQRERMTAASLASAPPPPDTPVAMPPWMQAAEAAASRAKDVCVAHGYPHGNPITVRSALRAAERVQEEWEAEHGLWRTTGPAQSWQTEMSPGEVDAEADAMLRKAGLT